MKNNKVITIGEALIDFIPNQKGIALKNVNGFERAPGGAPANVAAAVAVLGGHAAFIGKVGNDAFGEFLKDVLDEKGVQTDYMLTTDEAKTALAFVSLKEDGDRDFSFYRDPSADMLLEPEEIQSTWFQQGDILHYGSISLISEPSRSATYKAIFEAKKKGTLISYDPNIRMPLWPNEEMAKETILKYIPSAHIVKVSEEELEFLTGIKNEQEAVQELFKGDVVLVLITKGKDGCTYYTRELNGHVKSCEVQAADTTGAGDAFVGGLLYQLTENVNTIQKLNELLTNKEKFEEVLAFANICGAVTSLRLGAISALPTKTEVEEFYAK
ncbi:aminoimidazole riboside kinase [Bacillus taeanensis]|uniref:Aminoimidazole riboside kinase n=1 Tax=Bacillus taeanensis TaxID=273032 RepID=A0A366Y194_9BACI|nr:aminoimidazole riboside kinase [Bacillus taeanensis]RBW70769.1 aminoimidazole riboside kinase [Bacillus taeanensis]